MAETVYLLCALTSLACAALLIRGYLRSGAALLLWGGLCFVGLAVDSLLVCADLMFLPTVDLRLWRSAAAFVGLLLLLYGLVWEMGGGRRAGP
ncbi:MAG: hypothetical protein IT437_05140 [Phycisphaerales bacterium]|nr:hypothetical protein [Phycisphaerales bacterium]